MQATSKLASWSDAEIKSAMAGPFLMPGAREWLNLELTLRAHRVSQSYGLAVAPTASGPDVRLDRPASSE